MSKNRGQYSFFDVENQLDKIYQINDFLPKLNTLVDWEIFRESLARVAQFDLQYVQRHSAYPDALPEIFSGG